MSGNPMLGVYIGIGVGVLFILIMILVIPRQIKKAKQRGQQAADNMIKEFETRTGLTWNGSQFSGQYKGYAVRVEKNIAYNKAKIFDGVSDLITQANNQENLSGNTTVYPTLKIWLDKPGANFEDITLFQTGNFFMNNDEFWNNRINGRIPEDSKLVLDAAPLHKNANFYGNKQGAEKLLQSGELKTLLSSWIYPDLRADKAQITLELNNPNIIPKWGHNKTMAVDWMVQGLDICVAAAKALTN